MKKLLVLLFSIFLLSSVFGEDITIPSSQLQFIQIIEKSKSIKYENDLQRDIILENRTKKLKGDIFNFNNFDLGLKNWIGKVKSIKTNKKGFGIITISINKSINSDEVSFFISNEENDTKFSKSSLFAWVDVFTTPDRLMEPGSRLYKKISRLSKNDQIKFSGEIILDIDGSLEKKNATKYSLLLEPTFIFEFSEIEQIN